MNFELIGPEVGTRFPDLVLPDQHGRLVDLNARDDQIAAIVVFYRSAEW